MRDAPDETPAVGFRKRRPAEELPLELAETEFAPDVTLPALEIPLPEQKDIRTIPSEGYRMGSAESEEKPTVPAILRPRVRSEKEKRELAEKISATHAKEKLRDHIGLEIKDDQTYELGNSLFEQHRVYPEVYVKTLGKLLALMRDSGVDAFIENPMDEKGGRVHPTVVEQLLVAAHRGEVLLPKESMRKLTDSIPGMWSSYIGKDEQEIESRKADSRAEKNTVQANNST